MTGARSRADAGAAPDAVVRRRFPPYARALADARREGMVPVCNNPLGAFVLALGWAVHGRLQNEVDFPRVVLPLDWMDVGYDLSPLAGLDLLLCYEPRHAWQVGYLVQHLMDWGARGVWVWALGREIDPRLIDVAAENYEEVEWRGPRLR